MGPYPLFLGARGEDGVQAEDASEQRARGFDVGGEGALLFEMKRVEAVGWRFVRWVRCGQEEGDLLSLGCGELRWGTWWWRFGTGVGFRGHFVLGL